MIYPTKFDFWVFVGHRSPDSGLRNALASSGISRVSFGLLSPTLSHVIKFRYGRREKPLLGSSENGR